MPKKNSKVEVCPYIWSWDVKVAENGDVLLKLTENYVPSQDVVAEKFLISDKINYFFESSEVLAELKKLEGKNPFAQINYEQYLANAADVALGKIRKIMIEKTENMRWKDYNPQKLLNVSEIVPIPGLVNIAKMNEERFNLNIYEGVYTAKEVCLIKKCLKTIIHSKVMLAVFRSTIAYDGPYGGGKNSIYNFDKMLGIDGVISA